MLLLHRYYLFVKLQLTIVTLLSFFFIIRQLKSQAGNKISAEDFVDLS